MKLNTSNINQFKVIHGERQDDLMIVLELTNGFEGVLIQDNAGWSMFPDVSFDETCEEMEAGTFDPVNNPQSIVVEGIRVVNDSKLGFVVEIDRK